MFSFQLFCLRTSFEVAGTGPAALMTQDVAREAWIDGASGFGELPAIMRGFLPGCVVFFPIREILAIERPRSG